MCVLDLRPPPNLTDSRLGGTGGVDDCETEGDSPLLLDLTGRAFCRTFLAQH